MKTPAWILDNFAGGMLAVAGVSAARLVAARPWQRGSVSNDIDIAHLLMAIAMAGMLVPVLTTLPGHAWEFIFGLMTAWFACRVIRTGGYCAPHLVHSAAMLYMFAALAARPGMQTLSYPTLAFAFGLVLAGYCVWDLDQLSGTRHAFDGVTVSCRIVMGVTMALMLFLMI